MRKILAHNFCFVTNKQLGNPPLQFELLISSWEWGYTYIDDKLLRYLGDSLEWVNFSVDEKDVVYQGLDFEGVNTLYPNQITSFKKLILAWIVLFENANQTFDLNRFNQTQTFDKSTVLTQLYQLVEFCQIVENNPNKCLVHIGL